MPSDYEIKKKHYDEYMKRPLISEEVASEMRRQLSYANTIDPDVAKQAADLLRGKTI